MNVAIELMVRWSLDTCVWRDGFALSVPLVLRAVGAVVTFAFSCLHRVNSIARKTL
jgi:hypothetical protein